MHAADVISAFGLAPHPEGGFYRQTWIDPSGTAIYFLLEGREWTAWHRVHGRVEIWHFYVGDPVELSTGSGDGTLDTRTVKLGVDLRTGQVPQAVVGADVWQRARSTGNWSLVGCTVTPPFTFEAFEIRSDADEPDQLGEL